MAAKTPSLIDTATMSSQLDFDEFYPKTLEEELNEILEAFYAMISEDDIKTYQLFLEDIQQKKVAESAVQAVAKSPDFELPDQDRETVRLSDLLKNGPVVLVFYRGKWCPQCNATIMRMQRYLSRIQDKGATLVAISPMLPDGTLVFASKRDLGFPVLSDVGNEVARKFKLTFVVPEEVRPTFLEWGEDLPKENGDSTWEIPLPATYIISQQGEIVWSFVDNDPSLRGEPEDIVAAIPADFGESKEREEDAVRHKLRIFTKINKSISKPFKQMKLFGKKRLPPEQFLGHYMTR